MIILKTEAYCNNCPDFEARVTKDELHYNGFDIGPVHNTYISCVHAGRCGVIKHFIEKQVKKNEEPLLQ